MWTAGSNGAQQPRSRTLRFRVTKDEETALKGDALAAGQTLSDYLRGRVLG
jgi:hypothetical protein